MTGPNLQAYDLPGRKQSISILGIIFLTGAFIALLVQFRYHKFLNFDSLAYFNLAGLYAQGDWAHAVNGCWSPLYSWILALFYKAGVPLLAAAYFLNVLFAAVAFFQLLRLGSRYIQRTAMFLFYGSAQLFFLLYYSLSTLTPDLLAACLGIWFLRLLLAAEERPGLQISFITGLAGALMYVGKSYNFAFLNLLFLALVIISLRKEEAKKRLFRLYLPAWLFFLLLSGVWIAVLSLHEGRLVFSTAAGFTHELMHPAYAGSYPLFDGIHPPPFPGANSILTDPTRTLAGYKWSALDSPAHFHYQLQLIAQSLKEGFLYIDRSRLGFLFLLAGLLYLRWQKPKMNPPEKAVPLSVVLFLFLYPVFYLPLFMVDRYLLIDTLLLHLLVFQMADRLWNLFPQKGWLWIAGLLLLGIGIGPLLRKGKEKLLHSSGEYAYYRVFHEEMKALGFLEGQRLASDSASALEAVQLTYHYNASYYGVWNEASEKPLQEYNIRYILSSSGVEKAGLKLKSQLTLPGRNLYLYEMKNP